MPEASLVSGRVAQGSNGAGLVRRTYRRSPLRRLRSQFVDQRGLRRSDVFLGSYPRSGSSWVRFLAMEMTTDDANFAELQRFMPELGGQRRAESVLPGGGRFIKTHEPFRPQFRRAIHLVRDPRDIVLSYFRFMQRIEKIVLRPTDDEDASLDLFIKAMIAGRVDAYGTWLSHLRSWLTAEQDGRVELLRVRYEDLRAEPAGTVLAIGRFLRLDMAAARAQQVAERCVIERMREREQHEIERGTSVFAMRGRRTGIGAIHTGQVEGWRERLTPEQIARFDVFAEGLALMGYPPA